MTLSGEQACKWALECLSQTESPAKIIDTLAVEVVLATVAVALVALRKQWEHRSSNDSNMLMELVQSLVTFFGAWDARIADAARLTHVDSQQTGSRTEPPLLVTMDALCSMHASLTSVIDRHSQLGAPESDIRPTLRLLHRLHKKSYLEPDVGVDVGQADEELTTRAREMAKIHRERADEVRAQCREFVRALAQKQAWLLHCPDCPGHPLGTVPPSG